MNKLSRRGIFRFTTALTFGALIPADPLTKANNTPSEFASASLIVSARRDADGDAFDAAFGIVGVFDVDWLTEARFARLLDNLAASPGAFTGVRFFGALSSGTRENIAPTNGGTLWPDPATPPDFSATLAALYALTSRGLTPLVQLSFFPQAVSSSPIAPPPSWERWQSLVRAFLDALVADSRFGIDAIRSWRFEVWNEPNIPVFWSGSFTHYLDLYRATSQAVVATRYPVRIGGPALAYLPVTAGDTAGAPLMRQFLAFLRDEPAVQCDFISYHQKGTWSDDEPDLAALVNAADEIATMARVIVPDRCRDLLIINDEADEKVGFDMPYVPRMDERNAAWLAASLIAHDALTRQYRDTGIHFATAADNANLQLVRTPFDGRRSVLTRASPTDTADLLKLPAYGFYELLRFLGSVHGTVLAGNDALYPMTDLFHLSTVAETHIAALFTAHPHGAIPVRAWAVDYTLRDLPWQRVNIAWFGVDGTHTNGFAAAGGQLSPPWPDASTAAHIRQAAELALLVPRRTGVMVTGGTLTEHIALVPYTTALLWVTPATATLPTAPTWLSAETMGMNTVVRWEASRDPSFSHYVLSRVVNGQPGPPITPESLRAALWVDAALPPGPQTYAVRTVSASGVTSAWTSSQ